jgi:hypothetical protein
MREARTPDLPQGGAARLIVDVLESTPSFALCLARVPADSPFRGRGLAGATIPAFLCVEMAAQASSAIERGKEADELGDPQAPGHGWVVGVRGVRLHAGELNAEADFLVRTEVQGDAPPLRNTRFEVHIGSLLVAEGTLSTFDAP